MRVLGLMALVALGACSSQPAESVKPEPIAIASAATPTSAPAVDTNADATDVDEFKPPAGYKRKVDGGQIYYCTKIVVLGSRFPKDDCRTQKELEELAMQRDLMRGDFEQRRSTCASASGCAFQ